MQIRYLRDPSVPLDPPSGRNRRVSLIPVRPDEGRLTEPTTAVQPWRREPLFVPEGVEKRVSRGRQADPIVQAVAESAHRSRHSGPDRLRSGPTPMIAITRLML